MKIVRLTDEHVFKPFDCGEGDLNDFLLKDAKFYAQGLVAVTYIVEDEDMTVAFFSLSNDRISLSESDKATWRRIRNSFPHRKHRSDYPAVKIARLGVNVNAQHRHIGTDILDFVKHAFITNNRTGCCFVTVDALPSAVPFYERNGFKLMRKENKGDNKRIRIKDQGSGDGSLIRSIGIMKPSPNPASLAPSELAFAA